MNICAPRAKQGIIPIFLTPPVFGPAGPYPYEIPIYVNVLKCTWLGVGVYNIFRGRVIYDDPSSNFCMLSMIVFVRLGIVRVYRIPLG